MLQAFSLKLDKQDIRRHENNGASNRSFENKIDYQINEKGKFSHSPFFQHPVHAENLWPIMLPLNDKHRVNS